MPEVKTLRRKLSQLATRQGSQALGQEIAQRRIREHGHVFGFLYVDGHVRTYHGKHTIPKAYITRARLAAPATTDYWVNDQRGDPLFVVTAEANAALTRMLPAVLGEVRKLLGPKRRATVVFDRGGWSPKLFRELMALDFDILTYRKGVPGGLRKRASPSTKPSWTDGACATFSTSSPCASSKENFASARSLA